MRRLRVAVLALCALAAAAPAADAKAAKKKPAKPVYDFVFSRTKTSTTVARCPIVPTGGTKTVTQTAVETIYQSGRVNGPMYEKGTSVVDVKQEVENSEYVFPYEDKGVPIEWDNATRAADVAGVRKDKLTFLYSGVEGDGKIVLRLPAKGKAAHKPISITVTDDPVEEDGCTRTRKIEFSAGLIVTRRR